MSEEELRRLHEDCARVMLDYQRFRFSHNPITGERTPKHGIRAMLEVENARITRRLEKVVHVLLQARQRADGIERLDYHRFSRSGSHLVAASEQDRMADADALPEEIDRLLSRSEELVRRVNALTDQTG